MDVLEYYKMIGIDCSDCATICSKKKRGVCRKFKPDWEQDGVGPAPVVLEQEEVAVAGYSSLKLNTELESRGCSVLLHFGDICLQVQRMDDMGGVQVRQLVVADNGELIPTPEDKRLPQVGTSWTVFRTQDSWLDQKMRFRTKGVTK